MNGLVLRLGLVEMGTGYIFHIIHVTGARMKRVGIDGLYREDLLEGMMTGQNPLIFIPLNESDDKRSGGRVVSWIISWWKDRTGAEWGGRALKMLSPDYWFELRRMVVVRRQDEALTVYQLLLIGKIDEE